MDHLRCEHRGNADSEVWPPVNVGEQHWLRLYFSHFRTQLGVVIVNT